MLAKAKHAVSDYQRETVPFLGLNRSDDTREGEFAAQKNMSDRRYPYLAPRLPRAKAEAKEDADALFYWDGHEVVAAGGILYLDGEAACNVTAGPKQFAVVNTKLVVWPDKLAVDLTNKVVKEMFASVTNKGLLCFTTNSLSAIFKPIYASMTKGLGNTGWIWTYTSVTWTEEAGWVLEGGDITKSGNGSVGRYYIAENVSLNDSTGTYSVTADFPSIIFASAKPDASTFPEPEPGNDKGFYCLITGIDSATTTVSKHNVEIYWAQEEGQPLEKVFSPGDVVTVSGSLYGLMDVERSMVQSVDSENNILLFENNIFPSCDAVYKRPKSGAYVVQAFRYKDETETVVRMYWSGSEAITVQPGQLIAYYKKEKAVRFYESETALKEGVAFHSVKPTITTNKLTDYNYVTGTLLSTTDNAITITREGPALDYICEHENRLWGVSNKDHTIYASALGDPCNFYDYTGEDTDSYAVAVGSEGDFTGICSYGNAVLCWKERTLHKLLGSYPSNYQTAVYRFAGVRAGAHKSMVNVNETLFFLGVDGVYAYTGNRPSLISKALGADVLADGVGGTDGRAYYLSARNGEGWELLSYDTHTGLWTRSDETRVVDFCRVGDAVKFLSGDSIYTIGAGDESVEWEAVFAPMYETLEGGKQYRRLTFRVEVPKDGWMAADVCFDDGRWIQVGIVKGKNGPVHMPVPLRRCDKFQIRLRGVGDCAVLDMVREFRLRGER